MPAENNNPWSGELKAKRQKSRDSNKGKNTPVNDVRVKNTSSPNPVMKNPIYDDGLQRSVHKSSSNNSEAASDKKEADKNSIASENQMPITATEKHSDSTDKNPDESTKDVLKLTRKNLRPVGQPFKRSESVTNNNIGDESPVDRLLRQGYLENTPETSHGENVKTQSKGMQRMNSNTSGEGRDCFEQINLHKNKAPALYSYES